MIERVWKVLEDQQQGVAQRWKTVDPEQKSA
jgi:hypothetical protein